MDLPEKKTCNDCVWRTRCIGLGYTWAARKACDFYPIRYREREKNEKKNTYNQIR